MSPELPPCTNLSCFFCNMINEPDPFLRRAKIAQFFKQLPTRDDKEDILVLSGLWNIAMTHPDDSEFPSLGIFQSMGELIHRGINDKEWLLKDQNIFIPYYAAHIIGSYTMNKPQLAEKAVESGVAVVSGLMELLRGKMSWVEQRVAVRALGHLASHESTFEAIAEHEVEIIKLSMEISCNCIQLVYKQFIGVKTRKRIKYHSDLLTRGLGGLETENRKAEEWASQLQCWSLYLLNCFVRKERSLSLITHSGSNFLIQLNRMWGGLINRDSPAGIGLIRNLCHTKTGRKNVANLKEVIENLSNLSRSSDDWQYMGIDSLILLLKDPDTRFKVLEVSAHVLVDLVEIRSLRGRKRVGEIIAQTILKDYHELKHGNLKLKNREAEIALEEIWDLKVDRRKRENLMLEEEVKERKILVGIMKQEGKQKFCSGSIEEALKIYSKALTVCPLKMGKQRIVLYSNRAQCYLLLGEPEAAISDTTRALCLSSTENPHIKSLWRRSQAYDMKGLARESLMDCLMFINGRTKSQRSKRGRIPYYAARMINKQMNATWLFADAAKSQNLINKLEEIIENSYRKGHINKMVSMNMDKKGSDVSIMPTISEEAQPVGKG